MSKSKENLAIVALISENPKLKEVLESHGHKVGKDYIAPKNIASLALLNSLSKKGVDFDLVIEVFKEAFTAQQAVVLKNGKDQERIEYVPDNKTRLDAVKTFTKLMGIANGIITDNLVMEELSNDNNIKVTFEDEKKTDEIKVSQNNTDLGF